MLKFKATKVSAFLSGFILSFSVVASDIASKCNLIPFTLDSPRMFPLVGIFFFASGFAFVIGPQVFSIERIPFTGIPKNRAAWTLMSQAWGRMILWFLEAVAGMVSLMLSPVMLIVSAVGAEMVVVASINYCGDRLSWRRR